MSTIFWPRDVLHDGYFYGWIEHRTVCVAGVLNTDTVSQHVKPCSDPLRLLIWADDPIQRANADAALANSTRSNEYRALLSLCGTPAILGYAAFSSSRPFTVPHIKDHDASL